MEANKRLEFLITYLSISDPNAVNRVGYKYGYIPASSVEGREGMLIKGIMDHGDDFLRDMALNHPDRELILSADSKNGNTPTVGYNADGDPEITSSKKEATVTSIASNTMSKSDTYRIIIILMVFFILYKILG